MRTFLVLCVVGLGVISATRAFALKTQGDPTAEDYKLCGVLVHNAHSLSTDPQSKLGAMINSVKLFNKWFEVSGVAPEKARAEVKRIVDKSFEEFDSKEKFNATYTEEEVGYCQTLLDQINETEN